MSAAFACKLATLSLIMFMYGARSTSGTFESLSESADFAWEDFDAAISEEDCFGSHCGRASGALSLMQQKAVIDKVNITKPKDQEGDIVEAIRETEEQDPVPMHDIPVDDLKEAFASEDSTGPEGEGVSFVQTGASVERTILASSHASMVGVTNADGSIEWNPRKAPISKDGMMTFSVDGHGSLHAEDSFSLMQTDAHVEQKNNPLEPALSVEAGSTSEVLKAVAPKDDVSVSELNEYEADEGLSLIQSDANTAEKATFSPDEAVQMASLADGTFEVITKKAAVPSDGVMQFSVDGNGNFHAEEGLSLMQSELKTSSPSHHESVVTSVAADGSLELNPPQTVVPSDGMMHLSVDQHGNFHSEDGLSLMQSKALKVKSADSKRPSQPPQGRPEMEPTHMEPPPESVEGLSLVQTGARIERKTLGSSSSRQPRQKDGVMHLSVNSHGQFHIEH